MQLSKNTTSLSLLADRTVIIANNEVDFYIYSNKKETSDFHDTVSFHPVKMS